jgi:hypothetical protein
MGPRGVRASVILHSAQRTKRPVAARSHAGNGKAMRYVQCQQDNCYEECFQ